MPKARGNLSDRVKSLQVIIHGVPRLSLLSSRAVNKNKEGQAAWSHLLQVLV